MNKKVTVVIGASPNNSRFSNKAVRLLQYYKQPVIAIGIRKGTIDDVEIQLQKPVVENVDTVTLYLGPVRQPEYYDYIFSLKPKRVIFNPGTENVELKSKLIEKGIEVIEDCTLVMLNAGLF
ncbi:MAG: CoA-binding protein [Chlorobi bacterium]|nr:CoA-binding protein [Chlorobiota bacterium]